MTADFPHTIADLGSGDHLCCIYETEEEHQAVLTPFLRQGLERGEKVVYIVDARTAETILGYLQDTGLDVEPYLVRGQLAILTRDDTHVREGVFDPDEMIALLRAEMEGALAEGYPALRVTGEMTWVLQGLPGSERLIEYEARLNEFFPGSQCAGLCQYDRRCFDPAVLLDVLRAHPIVILGTVVYDNSYYIPPAELLGGDLSPVMLRHWLENLAERKRAEEELQRVKDELEKQNTRLEALYRVGQTVNSTLEPDAILDRLIDEAMDITRASHGQVLVAWQENGRFERRALRGFSPQETELIQAALSPLGQGINGRAYKTRQITRVDDVQADPDCSPIIPGTRAELAVPIIRDGLVLGNLNLQSPEVGAFRDADLGYLNALVDQVAIALANAQIFHAVEQARRDWEAMLNAMQDAVALIDRDHRIMQANQALVDLAHGTLRQIVGQTYHTALDGMSCPETDCPLEQTMESGQPAMCVHEYDGRIVEVQTIPVWEGDVGGPGHVARMVYVICDITESKRAEEALQERQEHYNNIIESIPSSLLTIDNKLRVVSANRNFLQKARRSEAETTGRRINEVFSPAVLAYSKLEERIIEVFETGRPFRGGEMERLPGLFGRVYFYRVSPLKDEKGEVKNTVLLMDDVTEQKRLSVEVRRAERHLASVVDSANDLVVSMDAEGRILTWNKAAGQTSGFRFREVKGQYLPNLCVEEDQQRMRSWLLQLARGQFTKRSMEINLRTKRGGEIPISWACSRMLDDEHRIAGLVAVGRDLTERKRLEAQLIKSAKLTSLGVMAGGIAHEIRNPLAIGSAAAQLLLERPDDEKLRKEAAEKIYSGIQRASYIVENLLKFARPPEERMAAVDVSEALEETLSLLANQLRVQQIELRKDFISDLRSVIGNKSLLQGVFSNLILNACSAMPDGGSLTVTAGVNSDNQVEIGFADTGSGIAKESLSDIFDPFFTTMPVGKGIGLGLSISYSIVQQHQGTIEVASQVGQGAIFTIRLPARPDGG